MEETRSETPMDREQVVREIPAQDEPTPSRVSEWDERARAFVRERPVASVGLALAVGYAVARLATRR